MAIRRAGEACVHDQALVPFRSVPFRFRALAARHTPTGPGEASVGGAARRGGAIKRPLWVVLVCSQRSAVG